MTPETFVSSIKTEVHDSSVSGVMETLVRPPGRRPSDRILELSRWFNGLSPDERERVEQVIELSVHAGVFGLLTVIDGVRAIEDGSEKGRFELSYYRGGERDLVTSQQDDFLHDIYQRQVQVQVFGR